jgi:methylmalonyl-CoA/ethylmalonyl-CoA epimerase
VNDLDRAVEDWTKILQVLDPGQLVEPPVREDYFKSGEDEMAWATFTNPNGAEIQLMQPLNDGPLGRRLARRGEGVHHICFTTPELRDSIEQLDQSGVKLTTKRLWQDPSLPWQWWTFISPESSHGPLIEVAHPYRSVNGKWEADARITPVVPTEEELANP